MDGSTATAAGADVRLTDLADLQSHYAFPTDPSEPPFPATSPINFSAALPANAALHSPPIEQPTEIAHFSFDQNHQYRPDASSLKRFFRPIIGADLSRGFGQFDKFDDPVAGLRLDSLLTTIRATSEASASTSTSQQRNHDPTASADFVLWRGMATKMMMASYEPDTTFSIDVVSHGNTIFLQETPPFRLLQAASEAGRPVRGRFSSDQMAFWGYKFESLATLPVEARPSSSWVDDREDAPVENATQYASVVTYRIGDHSLLIGGEVDCVDPPPPTGSEQADRQVRSRPEYVELKTTAFPRGDGRAFKRKLFNTWAQSFLLGVPVVVLGFRDHSGILREVERIRTEHVLRKMDRNGSGIRHGNRGLHYLNSILTFLKQHVLKSEKAYCLVCSPQTGIQLRPVPNLTIRDVLPPEHISYLDKKHDLESTTTDPESQPGTEAIPRREFREKREKDLLAKLHNQAWHSRKRGGGRPNSTVGGDEARSERASNYSQSSSWRSGPSSTSASTSTSVYHPRRREEAAVTARETEHRAREPTRNNPDSPGRHPKETTGA